MSRSRGDKLIVGLTNAVITVVQNLPPSPGYHEANDAAHAADRALREYVVGLEQAQTERDHYRALLGRLFKTLNRFPDEQTIDLGWAWEPTCKDCVTYGELREALGAGEGTHGEGTKPKTLVELIRESIHEGYAVGIEVEHSDECPKYVSPTYSGEDCNCEAQERQEEMNRVVWEIMEREARG